MKTFSVVISSCDRYADLWPPFFHLLFKFWPEIPQPVYLIANEKRFNDPRVVTIALGHDHHWGSNTLEALPQVPSDSILYLQDDYFLTAPADPAALERLYQFHFAAGGVALSLLGRKVSGTPAPAHGVVSCDAANEWVFDFQAAFWNKAAVAAMIKEGWTPWHAEGMMNEKAKELARQGNRGFYVVTGETPALPYVQAIRGGLWLPAGRDLCAAHDLHPDFRLRPCAPFQAGFLNRFYRSFLKRRSRRYRRQLGPAPSAIVEPISAPPPPAS